VLAGYRVADDMIRLAADRSYGHARQMVVLGLGKLKNNDRVVPVLLDLLDDEDVAGHAAMTFGKRRPYKRVPPSSVSWKGSREGTSKNGRLRRD
jgi:hypothetical protein